MAINCFLFFDRTIKCDKHLLSENQLMKKKELKNLNHQVLN